MSTNREWLVEIIQKWMRERCEIPSMQITKSRELFADFDEWARQHGAHLFKLHGFSRALQSLGFRRSRTNSNRFFVGIGLAKR